MLPEDFQPHHINTCERDDVVVFDFVSSELSDDANIEILGHELFALVDQYGVLKVVADMGGVQFITSSVLGKIITLHRKLSRGDGKLVLCNLEEGVTETLQTSRLLKYFNTAKDVDQAVAEVNAG